MPVLIRELGLAYYAMHKCANTSVKTMLFEAENGFSVSTLVAEGRPVPVHRFYQTLGRYFSDLSEEDADLFKFAIVRDPVSRIFGAWRNKVVGEKAHLRGQGRSKLEEAGLPLEPGFSDFLGALSFYRGLNKTIETHTEPLERYLGADDGFYDRVFRMGELDAVAELISSRAGRTISLPHANREWRGSDAPPVTDRDVARIRETYAADYEQYGQYF